MGVIYLLHFERPLAHAKHYIGYTENLPERLEKHRRGTSGAKIMKALHDAGIGFYFVRAWRGDRHEERRIKRTGSTPTYCPVCCGRMSVEGKRCFSKHEVIDPEFGLIRVRSIPTEEQECPF